MAATATATTATGAGKTTTAAPSANNSASVSRRLQSELMSLMCGGADGVSGFPEGDNLFKWVATIAGVDGTPYEGHTYKLSMQFPLSYPFTAPTVRFETPCFHPNVDEYGNICLDILKDKWAPSYSVTTVLLSIQSLLGDPNNDSPLNGTAANLWDSPEEYQVVLDKKYKEATTDTADA